MGKMRGKTLEQSYMPNPAYVAATMLIKQLRVHLGSIYTANRYKVHQLKSKSKKTQVAHARSS